MSAKPHAALAWALAGTIGFLTAVNTAAIGPGAADPFEDDGRLSPAMPTTDPGGREFDPFDADDSNALGVRGGGSGIESANPNFDPFDAPAEETAAETLAKPAIEALRPSSIEPPQALERTSSAVKSDEPVEEAPTFDDSAEDAEASAAGSSAGEVSIVKDQAPIEAPEVDDEPAELADELAVSKEKLEAETLADEVEAGVAVETARGDAASELTVRQEMEAELVAQTPADRPAAEPSSDQDEARWRMEFGSELYRDQSRPEPTAEQIAERKKQIEAERLRAEKNCQEIYESVKGHGITSVDLDIRLKGDPGEDYPFDCSLSAERFEPRSWPSITYRWKASGLCHKPLYFEEAALERYGHTWGPVLQPFASGAHFFLTVPLLPYAMGIQTPNECVYTLGYYRPGSCAPYTIPALPFTWRAAAFQGGVVTGAAFLFP